MPPKRPPSPSSSGSESGSSDASSSSSSEEQQQQRQTVEEEGSDASDSPPKASAKPDMPKPKEAATPAAKPPASDSESESESSESDAKPPPPPPPRRPSRGPDPSIKPISSKPMDGAPKSKKASPQGKEKRKRKEPEAAEEEEAAAANGSSGKKLFQRVWTEEDEIAVLKGMIQAKNRGEEPESAIDSFLKFIHKSLHSEFSKTQLADKMRRLKKKYETNLRRSKKGADPSFAKPHDQAVFELSKKIWGGDLARDYGDDDMEVENAGKEGGKEARRRSVPAPVITSPRRRGGGSAVARGSSLVDGEDGEGRALYPKLRDAVALLEGENEGSLFAGSLSEALDLLKPATAKVLEERWHSHFMSGLKYFLERSELKEDLLRSLIEALENA